MISEHCHQIFGQVIDTYHQYNHIDHPFQNPYPTASLENLLYTKCWIDTMQWHMEDEIRNPKIDPTEGLKWKRRIDQSNQDRTDLVERIDDYFLQEYHHITPKNNAKINTESPAWAIDRLSILELKIYHMREETLRKDTDANHIEKCRLKLDVLLQQKKDLSLAIDELLEDIKNGDKYMKVYRQMKMYNDPSLNPVLYEKGK